MPPSLGEKLFEPTPHRRQQARQQGHVAKSHDLASAALVVGGLMVFVYCGGSIVASLADFARRQLGDAPNLDIDPVDVVHQWDVVRGELARTILPILAGLVLLALGIHFSQFGFVWVPQRLSPDLRRIDPRHGVDRILSWDSAVRFLLAVGKVSVVVIVGGFCVWHQRHALFALSDLEITRTAAVIGSITLKTGLWCGSALLLLALADFAYQRWKYEQDLRMTPQELQEELRSLQGDPQVLARRRVMQRELMP